jgi:hypothetical protein
MLVSDGISNELLQRVPHIHSTRTRISSTCYLEALRTKPESPMRCVPEVYYQLNLLRTHPNHLDYFQPKSKQVKL